MGAPLPSGTVTLLFTDIEGSTQHWEERPDEMVQALRRHDEVLRTAIDAHGGHAFKTMTTFNAAWVQPEGCANQSSHLQRQVLLLDERE